MMGAGKSRVGAELARRLGLRFVDTDSEIERARGLRIREIFEREGEGSFRALERDAIAGLSGQPCVVALGGGAIAEPGAAERLAGTGTLVYLRARPESLLARVGDAPGRPLLEGLAPGERLGRLRALLAERSPHYESATIAVDTDDLSVGEVAARVEERLREREAAAR